MQANEKLMAEVRRLGKVGMQRLRFLNGIQNLTLFDRRMKSCRRK